MKKKKNGFTLVELLVVFTVLAIMMVILAGILNPVQQTNKANDARRKKDLSRIKTAFEEYNNDKGCYVDQNMVSQLMLKSNCQTGVFAPWISSWPCDPVSGNPYIIIIDNNNCPKWFKILSALDIKTDVDTPKNWYRNVYYFGNNREYSSKQFNFGISSSNVNWYDMNTKPSTIVCDGVCAVMRTKPDVNGSTGCNMSGERCDESPDFFCYGDTFCRPGCETQSCIR